MSASLSGKIVPMGSLDIRALADSFPGALTILDRDLRVVLTGGERLGATGLGPGRVEGSRLEELLPAEVCAAVLPSYRRALAGERVAFDTELGGAVYRNEAAPLKEDGEIVGVVSVTTDVTARESDERRHHELNAELETIFIGAPIGLALVDLEGRWERVNDRVCEIVGYPRDELLAMTFADITHPDDSTPTSRTSARSSPARSPPTGWRSGTSTPTGTRSGCG